MNRPETGYAKAGDVYIGYQTLGDGPVDVVFFPNWFSNIEMFWELPRLDHWFRRIASFARLIVLDQRGSGVSDPVPIHDMILLEERTRDVLAVLDAVGSERAALFACTLTAPLACYFAATHGDRTAALVLLDAMAQPDRTDEDIALTQEFLDSLPQWWGTTKPDDPLDPDLSVTEAEFFARYRRMSMGPGAAQAVLKAAQSVDVRDILHAIHVPTLVLHHTEFPPNSIPPLEDGRLLAASIGGARLVELGYGSSWAGDDQPQLLDEVEEFLTGARRSGSVDRVLASVLFTDVVGSTDRVVAIGDKAWTRVLGEHERRVKAQVHRHDGRIVEVKGEESLSIFDGPGRAIRCARAISDELSPLAIDVRAGLHTGEIEILPQGGVAGIAVHIGARICALAGPGELFVSRTVTDLVAGSGIEFDPRGEHALKGVPGTWQVYAVRS